jgi:glutamine synthetase
MQAGLKGRQMTARHFLQESVAHSKMNISTYFLTSTIEGMYTKINIKLKRIFHLFIDIYSGMPADGYEIGSWEQGFNDCHLIPDLGTIRRTPWVEATALVIADPQVACDLVFNKYEYDNKYFINNVRNINFIIFSNIS